MKFLPLAFMAAATSMIPATGQAALIYGLTSSNDLISFDSATPGTVLQSVPLGAAGIVDIDFYPANGGLYGANASGTVYRFDPATGNVLSTTVALAPTPVGSAPISGVTDIDFNPAADRIRVFAAGGTNYRLAPDFVNNAGAIPAPGTAIYDGVFGPAAVNLVGSAYTNNFDGVAAATTSLYSIDSLSNSLFIHTVGPEFSTVGVVGALGFTVGTSVGFDIDQTGTAWLSSGNGLYTVNLATGAGTAVGTVGGSGLVSIAAVAVPEASTVSVLGLTGLAALRHRRRPA